MTPLHFRFKRSALSADNGYMSGENLEKLEHAQVDGYAAIAGVSVKA
jgi:hypothetical protein